MNVLERIQSPTPKFFKVIRNVGLVLAGASAVVLASPVVLPVALVQAAVYAGIAGSVASVVSQTATKQDCSELVETGKSNG